MRIRETDDAIIVNPEATPVQTPWATSCLAPPKVPPPNLQRFEPAGRGPCICSEAAVLDRITGLCPSCWRCFVLGRP